MGSSSARRRARPSDAPSTSASPELLADFLADGPEAFTIERLDVLPARDEPGWTPHDDLAALQALWQARLEGEGAQSC